jgi:hypothetical protein
MRRARSASFRMVSRRSVSFAPGGIVRRSCAYPITDVSGLLSS